MTYTVKDFFQSMVCYFFVFACFLCGTQAFPQCWNGSCYSGGCARTYYAQPSTCWGGSCYRSTQYSGGYAYATPAPRYSYSYGSFNRNSSACVGNSCAVGAESFGSFNRNSSACVGNSCAVGAESFGSCTNGSCAIQTTPKASDAQYWSDVYDSACNCEVCKCDPCQCVEACEQVETTEPLPACGSVKTTTATTIATTCPTGACPLQTGARAVAKTVGNAYLSAANAIRVAAGLRPLTLDARLETGCQNHAVSMSHYGALYHASGVAEICAQNYGAGIDGALVQWQNSPGHRALLMNPNYTRAGVGVYRDASGRNWCVMRFN